MSPQVEESDDDDESSEDEPTLWRCEVCRKDFKSEGQFKSHETSKAHKKKVRKGCVIRREGGMVLATPCCLVLVLALSATNVAVIIVLRYFFFKSGRPFHTSGAGGRLSQGREAGRAGAEKGRGDRRRRGRRQGEKGQGYAAAAA